MKISDLIIIVILGFGVISGMFVFSNDLSQSYNLTLNSNLQTEIENHVRSVNQTYTRILNETIGAGSWVSTAYNIFFTLPAELMNTLVSFTSLVTSFFAVSLTESVIPLPSWFGLMITGLVLVVIIFTIVYMVLGRRV